MVLRQARLARVTAGVLAVVALAACGGGDSAKQSSATTGAPATSVRAATTTVPGALPCDSEILTQVLRREGTDFNLSPSDLEGMKPSGPPKCDQSFATQVFVGPPEPGEHTTLFTVSPTGNGWALVSVNCRSSMTAGQRELC